MTDTQPSSAAVSTNADTIRDGDEMDEQAQKVVAEVEQLRAALTSLRDSAYEHVMGYETQEDLEKAIAVAARFLAAVRG